MPGFALRPSTAALVVVAASLHAVGNPSLGPDRMFIRFTNVRDDEAAIRVRLNIVPNHHRPFTWAGKTIHVGGSGASASPGDAEWIRPGARSPWVDVGRVPDRFVFKGRCYSDIGALPGDRHDPPDTVEANRGDEISLRLEMAVDEQNRRFRQAMADRGLAVRDLVDEQTWARIAGKPAATQWEAVTLAPLPARPVQFYESANFSAPQREILFGWCLESCLHSLRVSRNGS